jgi:hypothetical protein
VVRAPFFVYDTTHRINCRESPGLAALPMVVPSAMADSNDDAYLAALNHGGLCCPQQLDMPISYADPAIEIS